MLTFRRSMILANRSGGDTGDPSSSTDGIEQPGVGGKMHGQIRRTQHAPVIQPGVATTSITSTCGCGAKTVRQVAHKPAW
eukprot:4803009-Prymnesium_polylepis.1